jgi:hypothetical protein
MKFKVVILDMDDALVDSMYSRPSTVQVYQARPHGSFSSNGGE